MRVLVVEDDLDTRELLADRLRPLYKVVTAVDGEEALEVARRQPPDLVLCDVVMPRLDGLELLRLMRDDPVLARAAFIFMSGRGGEAMVEALEAGADDYMVKPISSRELLARVRTHLALARPRNVVERFFHLSLDLMCIAGTDGYFRRVSPAFAVLGWSVQELLSRPFLDFVHPDDVEPTLRELEKLREGVPTIHFENRYRCADGSYRWLSWTSAPDERGTLYAIARDVTAERELRDALARARDEAQAANQELESFSYSVAHDLRAPLRSIDGFGQALLEDYADRLDDEGRRYLGFVRESAQHMAELIDDLLDLSRVTRSELHRSVVDLGELAHAAVARLARTQPDRQVSVTIAGGLLDRGDPRLLGIVLDNLIGNAWKFTGRRAHAHIEVGAVAAPGGGRAYFVRDDGAGFDMAFAGKLFGVFQRLHAASEFEGTGVGLATVQRVIHRHGGKVWAEAEVGRGATFYFTLGLAGTADPGGHEAAP